MNICLPSRPSPRPYPDPLLPDFQGRPNDVVICYITTWHSEACTEVRGLVSEREGKEGHRVNVSIWAQAWLLLLLFIRGSKHHLGREKCHQQLRRDGLEQKGGDRHRTRHEHGAPRTSKSYGSPGRLPGRLRRSLSLTITTHGIRPQGAPRMRPQETYGTLLPAEPNMIWTLPLTFPPTQARRPTR